MSKFEIQDKSVILKWIVIVFCSIVLLGACSVYIYKAVISTEWYHLRQLKKAYHQEYVHINEADKIIYVGISQNGEDGPWTYDYDAPESLFDDMTCDNFVEIEDPAKVEEILNYDWLMVVFKDASKSIYHISPSGEIYWGTSFTVECPSLLRWYKQKTENQLKKYKSVTKLNL